MLGECGTSGEHRTGESERICSHECLVTIGRVGLLTTPLFPQSMESQVEEWCREVGELQAQTAALPLEQASKELVGERQSAVGERLVRLLEPLQERRRLLLASKELHQVAHDLDDELVRRDIGAWGQDSRMGRDLGPGIDSGPHRVTVTQVAPGSGSDGFFGPFLFCIPLF